MPDFSRTNSQDADFKALVILLDKDLQIRDGAEHDFYAQFNKTDHIREVIVCYLDRQAVGCGAFKPFDNVSVEIKRMFVNPDFRGKGIGAGILGKLEEWAAELGYKTCVLETGKKQPEAIHLYQKAGYTVIPNYGQYENLENSVCMKKVVGS